MPGKMLIHRGAARLCALMLSLSILMVLAPGVAQAQMCVHYARQLTSFTIQGDAWTWWQHAEGRYQRGLRPAAGSVLVFRRTGRLHYGHVSVVSKVIDRRTILVDHSWLRGRTLYRNMKVVDTSPNNNWSSVKVWYQPNGQLGQRDYPTLGFIYPRGSRGHDEPLTVAANNTGNAEEVDGAAEEVRPVARARSVRHQEAPTRVAAAFLPHRKPVVAGAAPVPAAVSKTIDAAPTGTAAVVIANAPRHKPGALSGQSGAPAGVEYTEVPQVAVPRHKPSGHGASQQVAEIRSGNQLDE